MCKWNILFAYLIFSGCSIFCLAECPTETGQSLNLDQFVGNWYMVAGTPVNGKTLSKCGQFTVKRTSSDTFSMRYTAVSYRDNRHVTFNVNGNVSSGVATGNWQLVGSQRVLGPFKHIILDVNYSSFVAMLVCSENSSPYLPGHKFTMIWSRERSLPRSILGELKMKLSLHVNKDDILTVDHGNC